MGSAMLHQYFSYLQAFFLPVKCKRVPDIVMVRAAFHTITHLRDAVRFGHRCSRHLPFAGRELPDR